MSAEMSTNRRYLVGRLLRYNKSMQPTAGRRRLLVLGSAAADLNSYMDYRFLKR